MDVLETVPTRRRTAADAVVELRQYTLKPGSRDTLIDLFEREFVETQEAEGMSVLGQFRDLDDPERFVWLRGFPDMTTRARSLTAFYDGPVWAAHRDAARATMVDTDDVLLLRPAGPGMGLRRPGTRPPVGAAALPPTLVTATICHLDASAEDGFLAFHQRLVDPALRAAGAPALATLVTEPAANGYPRLPVREGARVLVRLAAFLDRAAYDRHLAALARSPAWRLASAEMDAALSRPVETLRLAPTARSAIR
ncbi:NIPSNAP family protein [Thalassobaculum sp.]|uniref:NIPSNAP family protein n=1 Tax=Thalassobaculum sp. TaxID=2022740 RepID=UPI0032F065FA